MKTLAAMTIATLLVVLAGCGGASPSQREEANLAAGQAELDASLYVSTIADYCVAATDPAAPAVNVGGYQLLAEDAKTKLVDLAREYP